MHATLRTGASALPYKVAATGDALRLVAEASQSAGLTPAAVLGASRADRAHPRRGGLIEMLAPGVIAAGPTDTTRTPGRRRQRPPRRRPEADAHTMRIGDPAGPA